ncbi:MAG: response regulator transcription factor [Flavobacteriales bacterium]|nr:response regulator transcription factor [Flavobacteriales bacterium]
MNCIIIDDDIIAREIIKKQLKELKSVEVIADFSEPLIAIKFLNENSVDFILLDIHMPNFNGFDFINSMKNPIPIILITSDKDYAVKAFEYDNVIDYLLKPVETSRIEKAMDKAEKLISVFKQNESGKIIPINEPDELYVGVGKRLVKLNFNNIALIEATGDYITINTKTERHIVHSTLKKIEEKLPSYFFKIHRSYVVNLNYIIDIEDNSVLIDNKVVPISRTNKQELINKLNLL